MSVAINRAILLKTRTGPTETVDTGEAYFWLDGASLKYKDDTQTTRTLSTGVTPEEVQDIVGTFITAGSSKLSVSYNDAGNVLVLDVVEANIVHQNLSGAGTNTHAQIDSHIANTSNPHSVTKTQVGLGNVDNTSDVNKPVSTAQGAADAAVQAFAIQRTNHTGTQTASTISDFTEAAQDAVGGILTDSASIDFTYNDGGPTIAGAVLPAGVDHDALANFVANEHVNHASVSITAGAGLTGGGDLTANRNIAIATTGVTASSYGSASSVATFTVNALGQLTAAASTAISILSAAVTDFAATVRSTVLTGFSVGANSTILATDTILQAFGKVQGQINALTSNVLSTLLTGVVFTNQTEVAATDTLLEGIGKLQGQINLWDELIVTTALTNNSNTTLTSITDLTTTVVTGKRYRIEGFLLFRSTAATNGITFTMGNATAVGTLGMVTSSANAGDGTSSLYSGAITAFGDLVISTAVPAANTDYILQFSGIFVCTTGGTIFPQYRSEVNGQTTTVQIGSNMIVREF